MGANKNKILNVQLRETYQNFLNQVIQLPMLSLNTLPMPVLIAWAYYLILQERIEEALVITHTLIEQQ